MKNTNISVPYDDEKLKALRLYMEQKDLSVEAELIAAVDVLYAKNVPANVREFIELRSATERTVERPRRPIRASAVTLPSTPTSESSDAS